MSDPTIPTAQPPAQPATPSTPKGYISEDAKKRFTIIAGVLGAVFFFGQMIVPFIVFFGFFASTFMVIGIRAYDTDKSVFWKNRIWAVETSTKADFSSEDSDNSTNLVSFAKGDKEPKKEVSIRRGASFLPDGDRLWIMGDDYVDYYTKGRLIKTESGTDLKKPSEPFIYKGFPSVIERRVTDFRIKILIGNKWITEEKFKIENRSAEDSDEEIGAVADGETIYLFYLIKDSLYAHKGLPVDGEPEDNWVFLAGNTTEFRPMLLDGKPAIFYKQSENNDDDFSKKTVTIRKYDGGKWSRSFTKKYTGSLTPLVLPGEKPGLYYLVSSGFETTLRISESLNGKETELYKRGDGFPGTMMLIMMGSMYSMMILFPFLLAIILALQMKKHRICEHVTETGRAPYASLTRRALAQLIDAIVMLAPTIVGMIFFFNTFSNMDEGNTSKDMFLFFGFFIGGFCWLAVILFVFGILEGTIGKTPGKWALGIRVVGTDLKPCGIGRGLLRNLLMFADGFFNFMIGILLVAFTDDWQRVGDMAARTIVIRDTRTK